MTDDADAEIFGQLPRPEDIPLDALRDIEDSVLGHLLRRLGGDEGESDGATSRFTSYM